MAKNLLTDYFSLHNAKQFTESISETANNIYYVFAGRHTPYTGGDGAIPDTVNSTETVNIDVYKEAVFGKKLEQADVKIMVPRYDWVTNTVYSAYSSDTDISGTNFFVVVDATSEHHVFKVLDNNNGAPSTVAPDFNDTAADDEFYSTSDKYVWKYMYTIDTSTFEKFATDDFVPVVTNANVVANAVSGAIDVVKIVSAGDKYNSTISGTFSSGDISISGDNTRHAIANTASSVEDFYNDSYIYISGGTGAGQTRKIVNYTVDIATSKKIITIATPFTTSPAINSTYEITPAVYITGDGSGAIVRAIVNTSSSNSITRIEVLDRGANYTYATATVAGNRGGATTNAAVVQAVLAPKGGHGSNPEFELGGKYLGVSVTFANSESGTISVANDYRTIGIVKDPKFANVELTLATTTGVFVDEELVTQANSLATGIVTSVTPSTISLSNVTGVFVTGKTVTGNTSSSSANVVSFTINGVSKNFSTFDNRHKYTYSSGSGTFSEDEVISQTIDSVTVNAYYHSNDASFYYMTDLRGTFTLTQPVVGSNTNADVTLTAYYPPDIVEGSGEVLYIENLDPIERSASQSERVKLILKF